MSKKDAFENIDINGKDKYLKRHQDALKLEKVKAIDKRIADFDAKTHNLDWAREAIDFCNREEINGKDLIELSLGLQDLQRIRQEALDIIRAEENKLFELKKKEELNIQIEQAKLKVLEEKQKLEIKQEKDRLKILEQEEQINLQIEQNKINLEKEQIAIENKKQENKLIDSIENKINFLNNCNKNEAWYRNVKELSIEVKGLKPTILEQVSNRYMLDYFVEEVNNYEKAKNFDEEIAILNVDKNWNLDWANRIYEIKRSLTKEIQENMVSVEILNNLLYYANPIVYEKEFEVVNLVIQRGESKLDALSYSYDYDIAQVAIKRLSVDVNFADYIENFEERWDKLTIKLLKRRKVIERKQQKKSNRKAKKTALQRRRNSRHQREVSKKLFKFFITSIVELVILTAFIVVGALNFDFAFGKILLSFGVAGACIYYNLKIAILLEHISMPFIYTFVPLFLNIGLMVYTIVSILFFNFLSIPLALILLALVVLHFVNVERIVMNCDYAKLYIPIGIIMTLCGIICLIISIVKVF